MPHIKRRATAFLILMIVGIFVMAGAMIMLMTRPAWPLEQIPCWKAKALLTYAGSSVEAEKIAQQYGYTKLQIAEVRRRCGL